MALPFASRGGNGRTHHERTLMPESTLGQVSLLLIYAAMAAYTVALLAYAVDLTRRDAQDGATGQGRAAAIAMSTTWAALVLHAAGVVTRTVAAGRAPWANMYEFSILSTLVAVVAFVALQRGRDLRVLGAFVVGPVLLMLGVAVTVLYVRADGVGPALQTYWLIIHVSVATVAVGVFTIGATLSAAQLVQSRSEKRQQAITEHRGEEVAATVATGGKGVAAGAMTSGARSAGVDTSRVSISRWRRLLAALPSSAELEHLSFRLNAVGFAMWTFTLVAGAIWAEYAWGRPWGWDPKEVWTFVIWVIYAAYLHARVTRGWDSNRAAYLVLLGFAAILGNYFIVNLVFNSRHAYSGIG